MWTLNNMNNFETKKNTHTHTHKHQPCDERHTKSKKRRQTKNTIAFKIDTFRSVDFEFETQKSPESTIKQQTDINTLKNETFE
jgi:hypothetical protein